MHSFIQIIVILLISLVQASHYRKDLTPAPDTTLKSIPRRQVEDDTNGANPPYPMITGGGSVPNVIGKTAPSHPNTDVGTANAVPASIASGLHMAVSSGTTIVPSSVAGSNSLVGGSYDLSRLGTNVPGPATNPFYPFTGSPNTSGTPSQLIGSMSAVSALPGTGLRSSRSTIDSPTVPRTHNRRSPYLYPRLCQL